MSTEQEVVALVAKKTGLAASRITPDKPSMTSVPTGTMRSSWSMSYANGSKYLSRGSISGGTSGQKRASASTAISFML